MSELGCSGRKGWAATERDDRCEGGAAVEEDKNGGLTVYVKKERAIMVPLMAFVKKKNIYPLLLPSGRRVERRESKKNNFYLLVSLVTNENDGRRLGAGRRRKEKETKT